MTAQIPKRVEIEARIVGDAVRISMTAAVGAPNDVLFISSGALRNDAALYVKDAASAREYAQQVRGVLDALVDFALSLEQPQNFAVGEAAGWPEGHAVTVRVTPDGKVAARQERET